MFDRTLVVCGVTVKLRPYTEKRLAVLVEINKEIQEFIESNPDLSVKDIAGKRASWYKRKADVLWQTPYELNEDFYASDEFESSLLKDSEDFFLKHSVYL